MIVSPDVQVLHVKRCLTDTGYCARHLLGYDWDEDPKNPGERFNEGKGGVRPYGPHQEMVEFLDSPSRLKLLQAPRKSLKSTIAGSWATRHMLRAPKVRVLYAMKTLIEAKKKLNAIKSHFVAEGTPLRTYFGDQMGEPDTDAYFNLKGRSKSAGLPEYSFQAAGVDVALTGSRYDIGIFDDLVDLDATRNDEQIQKTIDFFQMAFPLRSANAIILVIGTSHHGADLYAWIKEKYSRIFDIRILECGFEPVEDEKTGRHELVGEAKFDLPALQKDRLEEELTLMEYEKFCAQYLNRIVSGKTQPFRRVDFQPVTLDDDALAAMSGYILTDQAYAVDKEACYSVVALVGLDIAGNAYLIDLRVGHFTVARFIDEFFEVRSRWQSRITIHAELFEKIALTAGTRPSLEDRARLLGQRLNIIEVSVSQANNSKIDRIMGLQPRMREKRFYVASTVPRFFQDMTETKVLWHPEGAEEGGMPVPDGELVKEFIMLRRYPKLDIADALANLERVDQNGQRLCRFIPGRVRRKPNPYAWQRQGRDRDTVPGHVFRRRGYAEPGQENAWEDRLQVRQSRYA